MPPIILPFRGNVPRLDAEVFIAPGAVVIGDVVLAAGSSVWFNCTLRGDVHPIRVGPRTNIQDGSVVHVTSGRFATIIGADVTIGHNVTVHGCTLEDGSFVGMGATILDGAVIEGEAMLAAGALLPPGKRIPRGELWAGSPARFVRRLTDEELAKFPQTTLHYVELGREYLAELACRAG